MRKYCEKFCSSSPDGIRTRVAGLRSQSPRPLDDGALDFFAGVPGLEPRLTEPESAGLPITPYPNTTSAEFTVRIKGKLLRERLGNSC